MPKHDAAMLRCCDAHHHTCGAISPSLAKRFERPHPICEDAVSRGGGQPSCAGDQAICLPDLVMGAGGSISTALDCLESMRQENPAPCHPDRVVLASFLARRHYKFEFEFSFNRGCLPSSTTPRIRLDASKWDFAPQRTDVDQNVWHRYFYCSPSREIATKRTSCQRTPHQKHREGTTRE